MRILFISRWFPFPPDNGSKIRVFNLLQQLSQQHEITLLSFSQGTVSQERLSGMETFCRSVHAVPYRGFNPRGYKALLGFFSTSPRFMVDTYSLEMEALVKRVSARETFDVVVVSQIDMALYALLLDLPRVFEEIELLAFRERCTRGPLASKARARLTWWKLARFMARLLREFDGCTVVSEPERDLLLQIAPDCASLAIIPNGVDVDVNSGNFGDVEPDTLIYSGALTYNANFDAMEFFLRDIWPAIEAQRPNVSLRITGGYAGVPIERLPLGPGVELTGYLDDVRPAIAQSWAGVTPLRLGGGTRTTK